MLTTLSILTKACLYFGLLGAGGLSIHNVVLGRRFVRQIAALALLIIAATGLRLLLLNADLAGGLSEAFNFELFEWVWQPNQKQSLAYIFGALTLMASILLKWRSGSIFGAIIIFFGIGLGGHIQGLDAPGLSPLIVSLHVAIAAFWVTAPWVLWPRRQVTDAELSAHLNRFSSIAIWAIPLLFAGGIWLSLKLAGPVDTLFATDYGRWLLMKLVFATAALSIGVLNKFWVSKKIEAGCLSGRTWLRRLLVIDAILFGAIVTAIVGATTLTGPGG